MRHVEAITEIDARPQEVWEVLQDFDHYPDWNPFLRSIVGRFEVGAGLVVTIAPPGRRPMVLKPVVRVAEPGRELRWLGKLAVPHLFDGEHTLRVEALTPGRTRFVQEETFRGLLVPFTPGVIAKVEDGFAAMNLALSAEVVRRRRDQAVGSQPASWIESATTGSSSCST